ncbi:MAG: hypothetical protein R3E95_04155 [Thiolinea sp.]
MLPAELQARFWRGCVRRPSRCRSASWPPFWKKLGQGLGTALPADFAKPLAAASIGQVHDAHTRDVGVIWR